MGIYAINGVVFVTRDGVACRVYPGNLVQHGSVKGEFVGVWMGKAFLRKHGAGDYLTEMESGPWVVL